MSSGWSANIFNNSSNTCGSQSSNGHSGVTLHCRISASLPSAANSDRRLSGVIATNSRRSVKILGTQQVQLSFGKDIGDTPELWPSSAGSHSKTQAPGRIPTQSKSARYSIQAVIGRPQSYHSNFRSAQPSHAPRDPLNATSPPTLALPPTAPSAAASPDPLP